MILAMIQPPRHFAIRPGTARLIHAAKRIAGLALSGLLAVAPAMSQSSGSPSPPASASSQAAPPAAAPPHPDKSRARNAFQVGRRAEQSGDWNTAYASYTEAVTYDPSNRQYSFLKEHARFQVIQGFVDSAERQAIAGNIPDARALLKQALEIDPNYDVARERLAELASAPAEAQPDKGPHLAGLPRLNVKPGTRDFDYRGTTRTAYEEIGRQFGVTMVFDGELPDRSVRFQAPQVDFDTAVTVLSRQTKTFTRVVDAHTMFVTEDSPQKQRDFAIEVEKQLVLPAAVTSDEMNETVRMIREMTGITRTQLNTATRTLTVRSTEQNVALAQALLEQIEQPHGELMLEIELLELDHNLARQLGIVPPSSTTVSALSLSEIQQLEAAPNQGTLIQLLQSLFGNSSALGAAAGAAFPPLIAFGGGKTIFLATMPSATANFSETFGTVRSAQRILLRAQDGKPATFFVGDRYPISLGLLSSDLSPQASALAEGLLSGTLPRTDYTVGQGPIALATGDFNGDGHPDLVVANQTDGTISILLGVGDGTLGTQTPITIPAGAAPASPSAVAVGDFNDDGAADIAVTDSANNSVLILLGNGDGTFRAPVSYPTGNVPVALVAQDFDGDNQPDLAVVNQGDGTTASTVSILLGNKTNGAQNGTFGAKTDYPVGVSPAGIAAVDFNADGAMDLAVTNHADGTVSILLGKGDGTFGTQTTFATGNGPAGVATADFNADGHADLAVANQTDSTASILLGNGDGTFTAHVDYATGSGPFGLIVANFAGTNSDLAVADETANGVGILIGNGDGTFNAPVTLPTGNSPVAVVASDLLSNGSEDVISANNTSNSVTVTLNTLSALSSSSAQTAYPSAEYVDLGLKVKATPRLHANDEVTLQLEFDIKSLTGSDVNGIPILSNRTVEQTVRLREDETSVLSGIIQSDESRTLSGLPWTASAPGVGLLTGEDTTNNQQTEVFIIVTPRALRLPPHDVPAIYAGRGEPATPGSAPPAEPLPAAAPTPGVQPGGFQRFGPGQQVPPQAGQPRTPQGEQPEQGQPGGLQQTPP